MGVGGRLNVPVPIDVVLGPVATLQCLNGEMLEEVENYRYLESQIGGESGVEVDVSFRVGEVRKAAGAV